MAAAQCYSNLEMPTFITRNRQQTGPRTFTTSASLQERQLEVYTTVKDHYLNNNPTPLRMIVTGTADTGKSLSNPVHIIIRLLLGDTLKVSAPTGVASFIIEGTTLHSLLHQASNKRRIQAARRKLSPPAPTSDVYHTIHHH